MCLFGITKLYGQNIHKPLLKLRLFYREHDFHTTFQVSRHPVCTCTVKLRLAIIFKIKDPAVFEEITHNGTDTDPVSDPRQPHTDTADSTHDQVNLHAGFRRFIEGCNNVLIAKAVYLGNDMSFFTGFGMLHFPLDEIKETIL